MKSTTAENQIENLFTVCEVLEKLENQQKDFAEFRNTTIQLVKLLTKANCSISKTYKWLLQRILNNSGAKKGFIIGININDYELKTKYGLDTEIEDNTLETVIGRSLITKIRESKSLLIIDDLERNRKFRDCRLKFSNLLAYTVLSNEINSSNTHGITIIIGNKKTGFNVEDGQKTKILFDMAIEQLKLAEVKNFRLQKNILSNIKSIET